MARVCFICYCNDCEHGWRTQTRQRHDRPTECHKCNSTNIEIEEEIEEEDEEED